jgi:hypothetical protein
LAVEFNSNTFEKHTPEQIDSDSLRKAVYITREFSPDSNVSGYKVSTFFPGFKVSTGFVAVCVNACMNPMPKRFGFVMNPESFALV